MNERWYAVPGYKGKSQHGEIRDPHVLDASGQLVCVCEGLDIAERIAEDHNALRHWQGTPDNIGYKVDGESTVGDFIRTHFSESMLPDDAPPLPDGAVYAGTLDDSHRGIKMPGWFWYSGRDRWYFRDFWAGFCSDYSGFGPCHYAKPANTGDESDD